MKLRSRQHATTWDLSRCPEARHNSKAGFISSALPVLVCQEASPSSEVTLVDATGWTLGFSPVPICHADVFTPPWSWWRPSRDDQTPPWRMDCVLPGHAVRKGLEIPGEGETHPWGGQGPRVRGQGPRVRAPCTPRDNGLSCPYF